MWSVGEDFSDLLEGEISVGALTFDIVFPGVEIESRVDVVEHGLFIEFEADGVEGFGVVGFPAGEDDAGCVVRMERCLGAF